jgi:hypothetical protein
MKMVNFKVAYEDLMNAIILQAVKDYQKVLNTLKKQPHDEIALNEKHKIERFFKSEYFSSITTVDADWLIEHL